MFHRLDESVNNLTHPNGIWGFADVFTRLSDISDATIYLGNTHACRMFISFKSPMYLHAFADGGYAGADMNNPSDPNADVRWELIEFTYERDFEQGVGNKVGQIWINTTRVDAFQYPMGLELFSVGNIAGSTAYIKRGEIVNYQEVIRRWNEAYGNTVYKDCYYNLIGKDNLGGIIKQPSKVESIKNANIFDDYINRVWDYYRNNTANIRMGVLGRWEGRVQDDAFVLTCKEGTYWQVGSQATVNKPSTEDAIEGAGSFATGTDIDKTVQAMFCAAFNRGQVRLMTAEQSWDPATGIKPFVGGSEYPCNEYVKFFHDTAISASGGYTYAFAYDDTFDQSATCYSTGPVRATVTIGGFADGGGEVNPPVTPDPEPVAIPAAPAPSRESGNVMSFFSGAYSTVAPGLMVGGWGQSTQASTESCSGDDAYKFTDFNYLGLQVSADNATLDVSGMKYIHLDLYSETDMDVVFSPISLNPTVESDKKTCHISAGKWNSFDLALSDFPNVDFTRFGQFKFDGGAGQTFYLDNLYMWTDGSSVTPDPEPETMPAAPAPSHASGNVMSFFSGAYSTVAPGLMVGGWGQSTQASTESCSGDDAYKFTDFNYLGLQVSADNATLDVSGMKYIHLDLYSETDMDVVFSPISLNPTVESDKKTCHISAGKWNSFDLALSDFPNVDFTRFGQFKFDGGAGQTFYLDNLYMWTDGSSVTPDPDPDPDPEPETIPSAPAPSHASGNVMSFFSDVYSSVAPGLMVGGWGQSTRHSIESCDGDDAYMLTDFNYLGLQVSGSDDVIDLSDMQQLHIDIYATHSFVVDFHPISMHNNVTVDGDKVTLTLEAGRWNSFDMPMTRFPNVDFAHLGQFKFVNVTPQAASERAAANATPALYIDNLYAWRDGNTTTGAAGITVAEDMPAADVYDIYGRLVRSGSSLEGLPKGIYLVGGRKVAVK